MSDCGGDLGPGTIVGMSARRSTRLRALLVATSCCALWLPLHAAADDGDDREVRRAGTCTGSSSVDLRLRSDDGRIRVRFEVETKRRGSSWNVILLHERRIAFRGARRTRSNGELEVERTVPDWFGPDTIVVRATGPRTETCRATATL
jgi:hypothetical protein